MITPAGDPVNSPKGSGDGQNEFVFSNASSGVLTINFKASVVPAGVADKIKDDCEFRSNSISGSNMAWAGANPGGKATASGNNLVATVTFTGLPTSNASFGTKKARIYYNNAQIQETDYEVFFPKDGTNHPTCSTCANCPNWFYYWKQTVTPLGNPTPIMKYSSSASASIGSNVINFGSGDSGSYNAPYGQNNPLGGIDNFAWTVRHESQHYADYITFWNNNATTWQNARNNNGVNDDKDSDKIPNGIEDVNNNQIYDAGDLYDWNNYNTPTAGRPISILNDFEDWNCKRNSNIRGNHSADWSSPGMQHQTLGKYND